MAGPTREKRHSKDSDQDLPTKTSRHHVCSHETALIGVYLMAEQRSAHDVASSAATSALLGTPFLAPRERQLSAATAFA